MKKSTRTFSVARPGLDIAARFLNLSLQARENSSERNKKEIKTKETETEVLKVSNKKIQKCRD